MLSFTTFSIGVLDRTSDNISDTGTYTCFSSTITDTGYVNKTAFIRCIDDQNIRSYHLSNIFITFSILSMIVSIIISVGSHLQSKKKSKDTAKK